MNIDSVSLNKQYMELPTGVFHWIRAIYKNRFEIRRSDCLVVMSPCHILTLPLKVVGRKPLILDAGWSLTEGHMARELKIMQILKLPLIMLIDFISFHFADIVLAESNAQSARINKFFAVRKSKLRVQFTGLNEFGFTSVSSESQVLLGIQKRLAELGFPLIVLFRGKINRESGFGNILSAAKILKDSATFIFLVGKKDIAHDFPRNAIVVTQVTDNEMKEIYSLSDISIGQVSSHPRLKYTIPHKAFEAGFFSMPYITADSAGTREYLDESSAFFLSDTSVATLVRAIEYLKSSKIRETYAEKISSNYNKTASQKILAKKFDEIVLDLLQTNDNRSH